MGAWLRYCAWISCVITLLAAPAAVAGDIKSLLLMPGPLVEAHAKEEKQCDSCHSRFDKSAQDTLCLDCHEAIAEDAENDTGFHGRSAVVAGSDCKACHSDHQGRTHDIVALDADTFDHGHTDFTLQGKHRNIPCRSCHQKDALYRDAENACYGCHRRDDPHRQTLGKECGSCHQASGWQKRKKFDHNTTEFPLRGEHESLQCSRCHAGETYNFERVDCVSCHRVRDVHLGSYGEDCTQCHSESSWNTLNFNHDVATDFALSGAHRDLSCQTCHFNALDKRAPSTSCVSCHRSSDIHAGRHGEQCDSCHTTRRWDQSGFDHAGETGWPLSGGHDELQCLQCHRGSLEEKLDTDCYACHRSDNVHQSAKLEDCSSCHQASEWRDTPGFDHELATFPLEGMHAIAPCQGCHSNAQFHSTKSECLSCHREEDAHAGAMGSQCTDCHNPNGWSLWQFDHNGRTDFALEGAHDDLSCASCHGERVAEDTNNSCGACHAADDRHRGRFGNNCARCHNNNSFGDIQWGR